jgi:DNA mismatch repair protein MutS
VLLRRIVPGGADRSYGVHVAELAGLPKAVVQRAREVLRELEADSGANRALSAPQLSLFASTPPDDGLRRDLASLDVDAMTPLEALTRLFELRELAREGTSAREGTGAREGTSANEGVGATNSAGKDRTT